MDSLPGHDGAPNPTAPLVVMVGPPGSGKSTWVAARFPEDQLFGFDMFRRMLTGGDVLDQGANGAAKEMLEALVRFRMDTARTTVIDATNTYWDTRDQLRFAAQRRARPAVAVMMHTPLEVCLQRNRERTPGYRPWPGANDRALPDDAVIKRMHKAAQTDPPHHDEFDLTVHVHPTAGAVAYAYPGQFRTVAWAEQLLGSGRWGAGITLMTSRQAPLPWPTPVNARG